jgi:hypothetical protein
MWRKGQNPKLPGDIKPPKGGNTYIAGPLGGGSRALRGTHVCACVVRNPSCARASRKSCAFPFVFREEKGEQRREERGERREERGEEGTRKRKKRGSPQLRTTQLLPLNSQKIIPTERSNVALRIKESQRRIKKNCIFRPGK